MDKTNKTTTTTTTTSSPDHPKPPAPCNNSRMKQRQNRFGNNQPV